MKNLETFAKEAFCCCCLSFATLVAWSQPTVTPTSPTTQSVCSGTTATFTVTASGTPTITYQWQVSTNGTTWTSISDGASYSGSATATLNILNVPTTLSGDSYRCAVTNGLGTTNSSAGVLTVNASPVGQTSNLVFQECTSQVTGSPPTALDPSSNYQWQVSTDEGSTWNNITDGTVYTGTTTYNLTVTLAASQNGYLYRWIIIDPVSLCSTTSTGVDTLAVLGSPAFLTPSPQSSNICPNGNTTFAITSGAGISYQWEISTDNGSTWSDITDGPTYTGTLTNSLTINNATAAARYHVNQTVSEDNFSCNTFSNFAILSLKTNGSIVTQPVNTTVCANSTATFKVTAGGTGAFTYQWETDNGSSPTVWSPIGTSSATLTNTAVTTSMNGYHYQVLVQGACGSQLTSTPATLNVNSSGTWLGTTDIHWETATNWCGGVPVQATDVLIPAAAPNMPDISATTGTAYSTDLSIQSGAVLTISGGATSMIGPFSILGTVAYTATADQEVLPAAHGSLDIGGSGNKFLQINTGISNNLVLGGSAMLVTGNYLLTMNAGSNPISGATYGAAATSWIVTGNGSSGAGNTGLGGLQIAQISSSSGNVLFPIGPTPTSYNPALFTNGGATNDFTIAVNDQYIPGGPTNADIDRTWLVSAANAGSSNITLGLQWNLADENQPSLFNRASAAIIRSNGTNIVQESATGSAAGSNPYYLSEGGFSTLTQFSVATSTMVSLPLQLLSFSAQWLDNAPAAGLSWTIDPQYEVQSFIVQRSEDGMQFSNIGTVNGMEGATGYSFADTHPAAGNNSYRLQLVTAGGDITYSQIVQLSGAAMTDRAELAPSVTESGSSSLLLSLGQASDILYIITDISGHVVARNSIRLAGGPHTLPLDLGHLAGGVYFVRVTGSDGFNKVLTLVKK